MPFVFWIGCLTTMAGPADPSPLRWSPDARWLAFVQEVRPSEEAEGLFPLLFASSTPVHREAPEHAVKSYKIWAYSAEDGQSILLDESPEPLSPPAWSRDGSRMAFGRMVRSGRAPTHWELVVQDAPRRQRVIYREDLDAKVPNPSPFANLEIAWSGDGRSLAVSSLVKTGLAVLRSDTGRLIRFLDGASHPCWAPEDPRLAFFRGAGATELVVMDGLANEPRRILDAPPDRDNLPGPFWDQAGQSLSFLRRSPVAENRPGASSPPRESMKLWRVRADNGQTEIIVDLIHDPIESGQPLFGAWYSPDPSGPSVVYATSAKGEPPMQLSWCQNRPNEVHKRLNPLDLSATLGEVSLSPGGRTIALRFRQDGSWSPPALCDPVTERLTCVAPDDASRLQWLSLITALMSHTLHESVPDATLADGSPTTRPSLLPLPGEIEPSGEVAVRLRRLSRIGLPLVGTASSPELIRTRVAMSYLSGDYPEALGAITTLTERAEDSRDRARLLSLQAQVQMASGDLDGARPLIAHLKRTEASASFRVDEDLNRLQLTPIASRDGWASLLEETLNRLQAAGKPTERDGDEEEEDMNAPLGVEAPDRPDVAPRSRPVAPF